MLAVVKAVRRVIQRPEAKAGITVFASLLAIGSIFYWIAEDWTLLDAMYFSVVTLTTTGFGDIAPQTAAAKIFTMFYLIGGVGVFVAVLSAIAREAINIRAERFE